MFDLDFKFFRDIIYVFFFFVYFEVKGRNGFFVDLYLFVIWEKSI